LPKQIRPARTDVRLPLNEIPSEVRPLVSAINQALDRLDQGFRVQREFTADAAHELRTPLSILRTRVETLDDPRIAKALHLDIEAMSRVVGQLLDIAELEAFTIDPSETADAQGACAEVAEFIAPLALEQGREIALLGVSTPVWVKGNAEMMKRAIRNLAENAIKHAPPDTVVEFVVEENGTVKVQDRGPGIADEERELIFQRFWRRDRNQQGSTGLGCRSCSALSNCTAPASRSRTGCWAARSSRCISSRLTRPPEKSSRSGNTSMVDEPFREAGVLSSAIKAFAENQP
jgi:signal transduction histidine kinase